MIFTSAIATASPRPKGWAHIQSIWDQSVEWASGNFVEILVAAIFATVIVAALMTVRSIGVHICRNDKFGTGWPGIFGRVIARTRVWFMVMLAVEMVAGYAAPPPAAFQIIHSLFTIAAAIQSAIWARELVLGIIDKRADITAEHQTFGNAIGLIRVLVTIAFFAIALVLILDNLGVNVTGLVAGLGIGGIAIGLAAQGIFSDLFAALSIIFDKPFQIGDIVNYEQTTATVEKIGLKTTRLRSLTGEMVVISNAKLLEKELHNYSQFEYRRFTINLGVIYQTPPETCRRIPDIVKAIIDKQPKCSLVRCALANFGASSLDFELLFDVRAETASEAFLIRSEIYLKILDRFNAEGIQFAYPTQTTFTAAPDGTMVMPYSTPREK